MPTRFYLPSTGAAAVSPAVGGVWDQTGTITRRPLAATPSDTAIVAPDSAYVAETSATSPWDVLLRQYVSDPIGPQTISGTFSFVAKALESAGTADMFIQLRIAVVSGDGTVERGELYAGNTATTLGGAGASNQEMSNGGTRIYNAVALSPIAAQNGDRLLLEVGYRALNVDATSRSGGVQQGDPTSGTDYALAADTATGNRPWFELSATIAPVSVDELEATLFPDTTRVSVALTWASSPAPSTALIERVNADGTIVPVRGADPATLIAGVWVGDDYEAPLDANFYYQATSSDRPGETITSATYMLPSNGLTWLKHPGRPALNATFTISRAPDFTRPVSVGVFDVLGRTKPIVRSMRRYAERGELIVYTDNESERLALLALIEDGAPLFLATPGGHGVGNVYVSVGDVAEQRISRLGSEFARYWSLPLTIVDRPSGVALAVGNSWSDVLGAYASWSQLLQTEGTWIGVLEGVDD